MTVTAAAAAGLGVPFRLDGSVVVVTGASSGIGRHLTGVLAGAGATVVAAARREPELAAVAAGQDGRVVPVRCDVTSPADRDALLAAALAVTGRIDVLVSNAGSSPQVPAAQLTAGEFEQVLGVNLTAGFALAAAVAGPMTAAGGGAIIMMASVMGLVAAAPLPLAAYCAAKGGLVALTRQLACEWATAGIRVNAVAPGWFPSELTSEMFGNPDSMRWLVRNTPMRRTGELSELDGPGSDLGAIATTAKRDGDDYVISGAKTFVTNGMNADLVILAARTGPGPRHRGLSLIVVETGTPGFARGRHLDKIGLRSQDTAELFFDGARVPAANRLGGEGAGFAELMGHLPQERLEIAVSAVAGARAALDWTVAYARDRQVFGGPLLSFQHTRFVLAELVTAVDVAQVYVDSLVARHVRGELDGTDAAKGKLHAAELQQRVVSQCLQLHGGYGFMREYPIARAFLDARVQTIYGGTSEIMKEIVARSLDGAR